MDKYETLHDGLRVALIATPKTAFWACSQNENLRDVAERNTEKFDFAPVIGDDERILGVVELAPYFDTAAPEQPVRQSTIALGEEHLIGADSSILDFIRDADERRFRFVVSQSGVNGIVSLSDLQKLPVRATLFSLVTALEIRMQEAIRKRLPNTKDWQALITRNRRNKIKATIDLAQSAEGIVDELLFTQFCDKREIIQQSLLQQHSKRENFISDVKRIEKLRNALAHANTYAETTDQAVEVCRTVRSIDAVQELLIETSRASAAETSRSETP
ncbi:hypothetical protein [uncultured Martelella sp.]|uniref:hypothetical protein n=1 Tax=uncultured Martelella sp. TaxID=392331 RepID=UPI0029C7FAD6|nr:hypothetical protein [uncultured Martelella sp.]